LATFRKRPNGNYQAIIDCGKNHDGKRILRHFTRKTLAECKEAAYQFEQKIKKRPGDGDNG